MRRKPNFSFKIRFAEFLLVIYLLIGSITLAFHTGGFVVNFKQIGFSIVSSLDKGVHFIADGVVDTFNAVGELRKLKKDYNDLKVRFYISNSKEIEYNNMKENLKEKNNIISDLDKEIGFLKRDFEIKKKELDDKYQHDIGQVRFMNEKLNTKNETASKFEKLNTLLYEHTLQLEKAILNFKNEEKKRMDEQQLKFDQKLTDTKKRMLDLINQGKKLKNKEINDKFAIMEKFSILNHNSLLNELEFESLQLEDLLKQREHLDQVINRMKSDIDIHKNVEKMLINKNKKYVDMIKILSQKIEKNKKEKEKKDDIEKELNKNNDFLNENEKQLFLGKIKKNIDNNRYQSGIIKKSQSLLKLGNMSNKRMSMTSYKTKFFFRNNSQNNQHFFETKTRKERIISEKVELQKELIQKTKEIDLLRRNCSHYKDKLNFINNRYSNILSLFDTALEKVYKENIEDLKDIYIDFNEFNQCEFQKLSIEKKYSIVVLLIQTILPLINENTLPENIKKNLKNTQTKFYLNETNDSSIRIKNINSSFFEINMRENENKLRKFRDGTWDKSINKNNIKSKRNKEEENN